MTIQEISITKLHLLEKNPRRISKEQMDKLVESLENDPDFLLKRPVLVNLKDGKHQVYAGNQRVMAAKKLKWKTIPCIIDVDLDDSLMKSRIIKDNKTFGEFDFDILANEWDLENLTKWGFTENELGFDIKEEEFDESIIDGLSIMVSFNIKIENDQASSFENQLDELLKKFPDATKEKKI